ncbi:MAG: hypothetical protein PUG60_09950 [Lachnospiraceae bacterium]|nr:hypothetical protein [Lachnospiraceae bacterium]MDY4969938.1 hypothetical protein [Lachnospiraceae bacterium]
MKKQFKIFAAVSAVAVAAAAGITCVRKYLKNSADDDLFEDEDDFDFEDEDEEEASVPEDPADEEAAPENAPAEEEAPAEDAPVEAEAPAEEEASAEDSEEKTAE